MFQVRIYLGTFSNSIEVVSSRLVFCLVRVNLFLSNYILLNNRYCPIILLLRDRLFLISRNFSYRYRLYSLSTMRLRHYLKGFSSESGGRSRLTLGKLLSHRHRVIYRSSVTLRRSPWRIFRWEILKDRENATTPLHKYPSPEDLRRRYFDGLSHDSLWRPTTHKDRWLVSSLSTTSSTTRRLHTVTRVDLVLRFG